MSCFEPTHPNIPEQAGCSWLLDDFARLTGNEELPQKISGFVTSEALPATGASPAMWVVVGDTSACCVRACDVAALLRIVSGGLDSLEDSGEGANAPSWFRPGVTPVLLRVDI